MRVDDGTIVDSRQEIAGDPRSEVIGRTLATSHLWWKVAESVVTPMLDSAGSEAFAIVIGKRSVSEIPSDGSIRRTFLSKVLSGGVIRDRAALFDIDSEQPDGFQETVQIPSTWDPDGMEMLAVQRGVGTARWHFLDPPIGEAIALLAPDVIVDTDRWLGDDLGRSFDRLEAHRLFHPACVLVVPHTKATETYFKQYLNWVAAGRPEIANATPVLDRPGTVPNRVDLVSAASVPVDAEFGITMYLAGQTWKDPGPIESARALLASRYDLRIGIWDLVGNSIMRQSLLDSRPLPAAPDTAVEVPPAAAARSRSRARVAEKLKAQRKNEDLALEELLRPLIVAGWRVDRLRQSRTLRLPLAEVVLGNALGPGGRSDFGQPDGMASLLHLDLVIFKTYANVFAYVPPGIQVELAAYILDRATDFQAIAAPASCALGDLKPILWRVTPGLGADADWSDRVRSLVAMTPSWIDVFSELATECQASWRALRRNRE
jgi:hypothetical protein